MNTRKPIAITHFERGRFVVLCDDGTVWMLGISVDVEEWRQLQGVPQPPEPPERRGL
ncbi:MAG: hypothetical protein WB586_14750 [Chthoniobacterales bacterium]